MSILSATKINKSFGITPVLQDVTFHINPSDRIGIVGANGAGKSTLMKILAGRLPADSGQLRIAKDTTLGYLQQRDHFRPDRTVEEEMLEIFQWQRQTERELTDLSDRISALSAEGKPVDEALANYDALSLEFKNRRGYEYRSQVRGILSSLAFSEEYLTKKIATLSGGERTRLALASMLLRQPDVLLLDEPTNHLDIGTLKWLEQYLLSYSGTLVIISHDRYFLDKTVRRIFEIENTLLTVYEGNYSAYAEKKRLLYEENLKHYEQVQAEIRRQEEIIRRFKEHNTEKLVKRAQSREKRLARLDRPDRPVMLQDRLKIRFKENLVSGTDVLYASGLAKTFGRGPDKRLLFRNVDLDIKRGDRICLVGANGIGKTTLLKILLGQLSPDEGMVRLGQNVVPAYYDQEQQLLDPEHTVLDEVHGTYRLYDQQELRSMLGRFLFRGDDVFKKVKDLAGGEKARLSLLKLMLSGANLLIMDEPTNHLDIQAKEVFEDALAAFPGTLLIVSHDRYLLSKIPTAICELNADGITVFLGAYDYYSEKSRSLTSGKSYLDQMGQLVGTTDLTREEQREQNKEDRILARKKEKEEALRERKRLKDRLEKETRIARAEEEITAIEAELCREEVYTDPIQATEWSQKLQTAKNQLEALYEEWMNLP
jgi:ATP-binding cassette subfamily F protein 3